MNPILKKYIRSEDLKQLVSIGMLFPGGIGLLWAVLYWRNDIQFAIGTILIHVICGAALGLCIAGLANTLKITINLSSLVCFLLAVFWVSPILLFGIENHYMNIEVSIKGLFITATAVFGVSLFGLIGGYFLEQFKRITKLFFAIVFIVIVPVYFALTFPGEFNSNITIVNRLNEGEVKTQPQKRIMVFGIDGGTWDVIFPLLKQGKLPNLKSLMENGQYGILNSIETSGGHTISPALWTSIFTGKSPEKHGLVDWIGSDSRNRFSKALWNILNDYGQKTLTVNIPGTFPPEKITGVQISGFPIPGIVKSSKSSISGIAFGRLYTTESRDLQVLPVTKIGIRPAEKWFSTPSSYYPLYESLLPLTENIEMRYDAFRFGAYSLQLGNLFLKLLDRWEIFETEQQYAIFPMLIADTTNDSTDNYDTLYIFLNKNDSSPVAVLKEGQWSDWIRLGIKRAEAQFKLRLLSLSKDHLEIYTTPLFQSSFFPQIPYTYPINFSSELSKKIGQYVVEGAGWTMFVDEVTLDLLYEHLEDIATQHIRASEYLLRTIPDWGLFIHIFTESDRIQHAYWKYFQPAYYQFVDENLAKLHGDKINSIIEKIDASIGEFLTYMDENTTVIVLSDHGFQAEPRSNYGHHNLKGMYIFSGKNVKNSHGLLHLDSASLPEASILDITPTILYLMGYPVGTDMDGEVLLNIFDEEKLECYPVAFIDSYESNFLKKKRAKQTIDEATKDQLKSLGYIQ